MTYYDQENQFLRQQLQKEIPILTALIQKLYQDLDRKFHLNVRLFKAKSVKN